jgi:hypothetical protein
MSSVMLLMLNQRKKVDPKNLFDVLGTFEFLISVVIWHDVLFTLDLIEGMM